MDSITSKLSLYDILAMIVPGAVLCSMLTHLYANYMGQITTNELIKSYSYWLDLTIASYLVGLFINILSEKIFKCCRNRLFDIEKARSKVDNQLNVNYSDAWYFVIQRSRGSSIPTLEAQVAFVRNMIIPLVFMTLYVIVCLFCRSQCTSCCALLLCLSFDAILLFVMKNRQMKIYEKVFEDYKYLKRLEKHKENEEGI